jgi:biopolymer transport protein ExbD
MRFPRNARIFRGQLDASPFVGVLFLVAIFLLLNSSLVFIPGVKIRLPEASDLPGVTNPTVTVAVDRNGQLYFENQGITKDKLKLRLRDAVRRIREPVTLVLLADKAMSHDTTIELFELAREAGLKEALLATRPASAPMKADAAR